MKLTRQLATKETQCEEIEREKEKALMDSANYQEALEVEKTKLATQTAQFTKLLQHTTTPAASKKVRINTIHHLT